MVGEVDEILWRRFKEGDRQSFSEIYEQHFDSLFEYGLRLSGNREVVKESIQELFVKLWSNRDHLADAKNVRSYLLVSLRSTVYNWLQKENRLQLVGDSHDMDFEMSFPPSSPVPEHDGVFKGPELVAALQQLTPRQRELIYLRYFEELDYEEIAEVMQITIKGAYKLSGRALEVLRKSMNTTLSVVLVSLLEFKKLFFS